LETNIEFLTRKAGSNEDMGESTYSAHEWRPISSPVLKPDEMVIAIVPNVDKDADQDKDHDCDNLK